MWSFIHLFLRVFTFFKFFGVFQKNWRYKDISGPASKLSDSADLVSCSWDTLYVQPSIPLSPHQQPTLNCPSSGKHWSVKRFWWQMSLSSLLLLRPWMFIFSLPLVSSHTAKPLWQLGLEALGETELDTATPACPWGQLSQPHTLASTRQDPPDILFPPPDSGGNKQRWSWWSNAALKLSWPAALFLLVSHKVNAYHFVTFYVTSYHTFKDEDLVFC